MDGITLKQFRDALLRRRTEIGGAVNKLDWEAKTQMDTSTQSSEVIDIAQNLELIDREQSLAEQERRELLAVEHALAKIATGAFGTCEDCSEEIPPKRLAVMPTARFCAKCQAFEERHQNRHRGIPGAVAR